MTNNSSSPNGWWVTCHYQTTQLQHVYQPWWRHQMETFSALLAICAGNSPVSGEFPAQRPVTRSFNVFFDLCPINDWVNNREAGDLRRSRAHYDVIVMTTYTLQWRHNEPDGISNHHPHDCLFNHLFRRRSKKWLFSAHCTQIWKLNRISVIIISKVAWKCIGCWHWVQRCVTAPHRGGQLCSEALKRGQGSHVGMFFLGQNETKCILCA